MPEFLKLQRLNRRLFFLVSGILWAVFFAAVISVFMAYAPSFNPTVPGIMKLITTIVGLKYYALALTVISALIFSYAYLGRCIDGNISPWIALIPLALFYGLLAWVIVDFILLWQESNLLMFIAKLKRFLETPTIAHFQGLFAPEWIAFMATKKRLLDYTLALYLLILVSALGIPSQREANSYGAPRKLSGMTQLISVLFTCFFIVVSAVILYLGGYFFTLENPASYLTNYEQFMQLLHQWKGY